MWELAAPPLGYQSPPLLAPLLAHYRQTDRQTDRQGPRSALIMRTSVEELRKRIHERQLETANEDRFLPDVALSEVITEQVVVDVISSSSIPRHEQKDHLIEFVLHDARKIFCILVWIREVPFIDSFFRSREVDPRLPFKLEYLVEIGVSGTAAREFVTRQWDYIAPVFDNGTRRLELRHILPFKSVKGIPNAVGGYGAVRQVELYNAHQKLVAGSSTGAGTVSLSCSEQPQWIMS